MNRLHRFIAASGMANLADGVATVAWAWLATGLTRDPLLIALVPVALRMPWFLFALPAGIVTDRTDRRRLILSMDILRAVTFAAAAIVVWLSLPLAEPPSRGLAEPVLYFGIMIAAFVVGVAEVFRDNAAQTMLPSIVPHEALERANGRLWSVELVTNTLLGTALGAFLIAFYLPLPFALNAVAYVVAVLLILQLRGDFKPAQTVARDWRRELGEGFAFLKSAPLLRDLALLTGFWNLFFQMVLIALVLHVQENLGAGAPVYGLILSAGAIGGVLGGFLGDRIIRAVGPAKATQWSLAFSPLCFGAIAIAPNAITLGVIMAVFEFTGIVWNTVSVSYRQRAIPDRLLGRVNSLYRLLAWGMMPVGLVLSGLIVLAAEGPMTRSAALVMPFVVAAIGSAVLTAVGWRALGRGFAP